eukprot:TRINITY_DN12282_c0_g1_i1.p1 TRINITY_DN12282_c0_g1~~TRINITY_DN12282_c0_g1_i1.p1  ORF type:complete len:204 (-),score=21.36 TRINITY_DN12282_c0_g1_i1:225-836(-)
MAGAAVALKSGAIPGACFAQNASRGQSVVGSRAALLCRSHKISASSQLLAYKSASHLGTSCRVIERSFMGRTRTLRRTAHSKCRASAGASPGGGSVLTPELRTAVEEFLQEHKVVLFMKGNRQFPQCGFSNTCVQILNMIQAPYETVNILENETLRTGMKEYSSWPTFPQIYIDGEFIGGCDIAIELYQSGELKELVEKALVS